METTPIKSTGAILVPFGRFIEDLNHLERIFERNENLSSIVIDTIVYDDPHEGFAIENGVEITTFKMNVINKRPDIRTLRLSNEEIVQYMTSSDPSNPLSGFLEIEVLKELIERSTNLIIPSQFVQNQSLILDPEVIYNIKQELKSWLEKLD